MRRDSRERLVRELERVATELEGAPARAMASARAMTPARAMASADERCAGGLAQTAVQTAVELGSLQAHVDNAVAGLRAIINVYLTTRGRR